VIPEVAAQLTSGLTTPQVQFKRCNVTERIPLRIILLGPPGSGKGTQANRLCSRYKFGHVSTGDLLRRNTEMGTVLGLQARACMEAGTLVPDTLIYQLLEDLYNRREGENVSFILDGFPRAESQARALSGFLEEHGQTVHMVLLLELDDNEIVGRLVHRRSCPKCGRSYHLKAMPPKVEGVCDEDGTELVWRSDDHEDVIRNRLATYHEQTEPVAAFYKSRGVLTPIDAANDADEVADRIATVLDEMIYGLHLLKAPHSGST
jgi:adenylate kinase